MNRGFWTASLWLIVIGLGLIAAGMILAVYDQSRELYRGHARARVVELARVEEDGRFRSRYYPVVEYYANGMLCKVTLAHMGGSDSYLHPFGNILTSGLPGKKSGMLSRRPGPWEIGYEVNILYDPANPEHIQVLPSNLRTNLPALLGGAGVILILTGVFSFLRFANRG